MGTLLLAEWGRDTQLTIKLGHLFTQFNFAKNSLELRLIDTGDKPAGHVGKRLAERRIQDLQNKLSLHYWGRRGKKRNQEPCQTCLYIQSMEQTTAISARLTLSPTRKVRVLRCWFSRVRTFFTSSLACSVAYNDPHKQITKYYMNLCIFYIVKYTDLKPHGSALQPNCSLQMLHEKVWSENTELQTCLLNCMIPRVGKTHALAGGMISESAKLTHCSTWAAAVGLVPRSSSLPTVEETSSNLQRPIL